MNDAEAKAAPLKENNEANRTKKVISRNRTVIMVSTVLRDNAPCQYAAKAS